MAFDQIQPSDSVKGTVSSTFADASFAIPKEFDFTAVVSATVRNAQKTLEENFGRLTLNDNKAAGETENPPAQIQGRTMERTGPTQEQTGPDGKVVPQPRKEAVIDPDLKRMLEDDGKFLDKLRALKARGEIHPSDFAPDHPAGHNDKVEKHRAYK